MLRIVTVKGIDRVCAFCDWCAEGIARAEDGNYEWTHAADGAGSSLTTIVDAQEQMVSAHVFLVHKHCTRLLEAANGGRRHYARSAWGELRCLPIYLGENLELDWREARETADRLGSL